MENNDNICPSCGHENRDEHQFCTQCGVRLNREDPYNTSLVMLYGEGKEIVFPLKTNYTSVGRDVNNAIVLRDEKISKKHAGIIIEEDSYWIEDLGSKNGVYVNGKRVTHRERLYNGSLIKLGGSILKFRAGVRH